MRMSGEQNSRIASFSFVPPRLCFVEQQSEIVQASLDIVGQISDRSSQNSRLSMSPGFARGVTRISRFSATSDLLRGRRPSDPGQGSCTVTSTPAGMDPASPRTRFECEIGIAGLPAASAYLSAVAIPQRNSNCAHWCQDNYEVCGFQNVGKCVPHAAHNDLECGTCPTPAQ